ncbi:MAG TPA: hypothetical protein VEB62_08165 [Brevundimonas sp.]|nr:hypothetical protein [Brevundimonas sp.]
MAENAEDRAGRRRRHWIIAAWAAVAALIVLPLVVLWLTTAIGI